MSAAEICALTNLVWAAVSLVSSAAENSEKQLSAKKTEVLAVETPSEVASEVASVELPAPQLQAAPPKLYALQTAKGAELLPAAALACALSS